MAPGVLGVSRIRRVATVSVGASVLIGCASFSAGTGPVPATPTTSRHLAAATVLSGSGFAGSKWGDATADSMSKDAYGQHASQKDPGSLYTIENAIGARSVWSNKDSQGRSVTGQGVAVAVLDSGVTRTTGLNAVNKVTYGPDLSIEGNGVLADQDTYGHGTFMAGIIGGRGTGNPSADLATAPASIQLGIAPDASLLSLKLATTDGSTDVSQVIAAPPAPRWSRCATQARSSTPTTCKV